MLPDSFSESAVNATADAEIQRLEKQIKALRMGTANCLSLEIRQARADELNQVVFDMKKLLPESIKKLEAITRKVRDNQIIRGVYVNENTMGLVPEFEGRFLEDEDEAEPIAEPSGNCSSISILMESEPPMGQEYTPQSERREYYTEGNFVLEHEYGVRDEAADQDNGEDIAAVETDPDPGDTSSFRFSLGLDTTLVVAKGVTPRTAATTAPCEGVHLHIGIAGDHFLEDAHKFLGEMRDHTRDFFLKSVLKKKDLEIEIYCFGASDLGYTSVVKLKSSDHRFSVSSARRSGRNSCSGTKGLNSINLLFTKIDEIVKGKLSAEDTIFEAPHIVSYCAAVELRMCQ